MKKLFAVLAVISISLAGCGGGVELGIDAVPVTPVVQSIYAYLRHPTISGLAYFNSETGSEAHLTASDGGYVGYTGGDIVTFTLGDIVLFNVPGDLSGPYLSLYDANAFTTSILYSDTAVENLMAFFMAIDEDGDYRNGIQITNSVRVAATGLHVNFNQSAINFRNDPAVQFATAVLSGNTFYGTRTLPSPSEVVFALQFP